METQERKALEGIKSLVRNQVMSDEGEDCTPPSYLDIYNLACHGLTNPSAREAKSEPDLENS